MIVNKILQIIFRTLSLFSVIALSLSILGFVALRVNWRLFYWDKEDSFNVPTVTVYPTTQIVPSNIVINSDARSLADGSINLNSTDNVNNTFFNYAQKTLGLIINNNWSGNITDLFPINYSDFSKTELDSYTEWMNNSIRSKTIPNDLLNIYTSSNSIVQIKQIVNIAQSEYFKYLKAAKVNQDFINELETNTLPITVETLSIDHQNLYSNPQSYVDFIKNDKGEIINNDFSKLTMIIYSTDIYKTSIEIEESGVVPKSQYLNDNEKHILSREIAIRYIVYKQMTAGLQRAIDTVNSPEKYKHEKDSYLKASSSLSGLQSSVDINWGGLIYNQINNRTLLLKRQQNYLSTEVLSSVYKFATGQKELFRYKFFDRYSILGTRLAESINIFNDSYSKFPYDNIKGKILSDFISTINIKNIYKSSILFINNEYTFSIDYIACYVPLNEAEINEFWGFLKI